MSDQSRTAPPGVASASRSEKLVDPAFSWPDNALSAAASTRAAHSPLVLRDPFVGLYRTGALIASGLSDRLRLSIDSLARA